MQSNHLIIIHRIFKTHTIYIWKIKIPKIGNLYVRRFFNFTNRNKMGSNIYQNMDEESFRKKPFLHHTTWNIPYTWIQNFKNIPFLHHTTWNEMWTLKAEVLGSYNAKTLQITEIYWHYGKNNDDKIYSCPIYNHNIEYTIDCPLDKTPPDRKLWKPIFSNGAPTSSKDCNHNKCFRVFMLLPHVLLHGCLTNRTKLRTFLIASGIYSSTKWPPLTRGQNSTLNWVLKLNPLNQKIKK